MIIGVWIYDLTATPRSQRLILIPQDTPLIKASVATRPFLSLTQLAGWEQSSSAA
jgi:hypothetical protein